MVKHGRNKKRRAGRIGRTKLKNYRAFNRWDPKPKITNPIVKRHWDPSKSPSVNLANMGLVATPNTTITTSSSSSNHDDTTNKTNKYGVVELFEIPQSDDLTKPKRLPLNKEEQIYISKCLTKYGTNYTKMSRDTKGVNTMQHTKEKLSKMGSRFLLLTSEQRLVPTPENVKSLISSSDN